MIATLEGKIDALRRDIRRLIKLFEARDPNRSLTVSEFCAAEGMSRAEFYRSKHRPQVYFVGAPSAKRRSPRISPQAHAKYRDEREQMAREEREQKAREATAVAAE
jgi:hypothetical protein